MLPQVRVRPHRRKTRAEKKEAVRTSITTEQVQKEQRIRHIIAHKTTQRIYPTAEAREWGTIYKSAGEEAQFGVILTWLKLITLNEADAQPWNDIYDAAIEDTRLSDRDKEVLTELVLAMQQRSALGTDARTAAETEREYQQLLIDFQVDPA